MGTNEIESPPAPAPMTAHVDPGAVVPRRLGTVANIRARLQPVARPVEEPPSDGQGLFRALIERLPYDLQNSLSDAQRVALREAAEALHWGTHPLDIRLSLPLLRHRYYLVTIAGRERRGATRLRRERGRHSMLKLGNMLSLVLLIFGVLGTGNLIWLLWRWLDVDKLLGWASMQGF